MNRALSLFLVMGVVVLSGCVTDLKKNAVVAPLQPMDEQGLPAELQKDAHVSLPHGLSMRKLKKGSTWIKVGTIMSGTVYKPYQDVLTVRSGGWSVEMHEAYLVLSGKMLVGIYLPAEGRVVQLKKPILLL